MYVMYQYITMIINYLTIITGPNNQWHNHATTKDGTDMVGIRSKLLQGNFAIQVFLNDEILISSIMKIRFKFTLVWKS